MPETRKPLDLANFTLADLADAIGDRGAAPVEQWNPDHCGDSEMRIAADGTWYHQGSPIGRPAMVRLFASVLRREDDGSYVLVSPVEKLSIEVDRTPFRALAVKSEGESKSRTLAFQIDHADPVIAGPDNPLRFAADLDGTVPRLLVRGGLEAALERPVYYELAELALAEGGDPPGLWSNGAFFAFPTE